MKRKLLPLLVALLGASCWITAAWAEQAVEALIMRTPDVSAEHIVFSYANDIWLAPRNGGMAWPLSSPDGQELFPRFSADGQTIAFTANYDGSLDVYCLPLHGGIPQRMTCDPAEEVVVDWAPDGRVLYASGLQTPYKGSRLYYASPNGGLPEQLPLFLAATGSFNADGTQLAYMPWSAENRTWNRYQGGLAPDVWLFDVAAGQSKKLTDFVGTDACPMFMGTRVYYISDAGPEHRRNIWYYDTANGQRAQVTNFDRYETKYPSAGPDCIVLENGGRLFLLSVPGHELTPLEIQLPGDRKALRPQRFDAAKNITEASLSPGAKRVAVNARGDIWTLPAENGFPRNLTSSEETVERSPSWSPDGKWLAYFSDASGEYELCLRSSDGKGEARQLTKDNRAFLFNPSWSPDSKWLAYSNKAAELMLCSVETGEVRKLYRNPWSPNGGVPLSWAPDSKWIAFEGSDSETSNGIVMLYSVVQDKSYAVTSTMFNSGSPAFDKSGDHLYFVTNRHFEPSFGDVEDYENFLFRDSAFPVVATLRRDQVSPFAPKNDEEEIKAEEPAADEKSSSKAKEEPAAGSKEKTGSEAGSDDSKEVKIDVEGLEARAVPLPVKPGGYWGLSGGKGGVFYLQRGASWNDPASLKYFNLEAQEEAQIHGNVNGYEVTPDGSHALVLSGGQMFIHKTAPGSPAPKGPVSTAGMQVEINPRAEWRAIVRDVYRIYRDYFYDPNMHGVDWKGQLQRSLRLIETAATRDDLTYIISEMVSELNVGHAYVWAWPSESGPSGNIGLLGCDFRTGVDSEGRKGVQFGHIYRGADWEIEAQGPLSQPGINLKEGEFLLAVNGVATSPDRSPYWLLQGQAGMTLKLQVGPSAVPGADSREVLVQALHNDSELRLRDWIESRRSYVDQQTGGRSGYIYLRSTGEDGLIDLQRQLAGQYRKAGLVIDERWNGGGFIPHRFIELLNRPLRSYWARPDGNSWRTPNYAHIGPKVMLMNEHAGSGGDCLPYYFRQSGLGKLVGTRTWGGLVGLSGNPQPIDGSIVTVPTFGFYETDGTWGIEGHGVDPDIHVVNDPALEAKGQDAQLDAAIAVILEELKTAKTENLPKPAYPIRSGAGLPESDK